MKCPCCGGDGIRDYHYADHLQGMIVLTLCQTCAMQFFIALRVLNSKAISG